MPGIVGLITRKNRQQAEAELRRMVEAVRHEAFYVTGTWIDATMGVYVGWALRKGSFADGVPFHSETGDITLVVSGEEYAPSGAAGSSRNGGSGAASLVRRYQDDPHFPAS